MAYKPTNQALGLKNIMDEETIVPTPEELAAEEAAIADPKQEEIRASVIEKYGLDEDEQADLIDKLTEDIIAQKKSFGKVVHQKRTWREKAKGSKPDADKKNDNKNLSADEIRQQAKNDLIEEFAKRDLEGLDVSDKLKDEIKKIAKFENISITQASKNPYIVYLKSQEDADKKLENATFSRKNNGAKVVIDTTKPLNPADFDLSTDEGRKSWDAAKKARKNS